MTLVTYISTVIGILLGFYLWYSASRKITVDRPYSFTEYIKKKYLA